MVILPGWGMSLTGRAFEDLAVLQFTSGAVPAKTHQ